MLTNRDIQLSATKLLFPIQPGNATVKDTVEVKNALPRISANAKENIVCFKAFSVVRDRYSLSPSTGFISPGESIVLTFSLETGDSSITQDPNKKILPAEGEDRIYLFFALVPVSMVNDFLSPWDPTKVIANARMVQMAAADFWKKHADGGTVISSTRHDSTTVRKRLKCFFKHQETLGGNVVTHGDSKDSVTKATSAIQPHVPTPTAENINLRQVFATPQNTTPTVVFRKVKTEPKRADITYEFDGAPPRDVGTSALTPKKTYTVSKSSLRTQPVLNASTELRRRLDLSTVGGTIREYLDPELLMSILLSVQAFSKTVLCYRISYAMVFGLLIISFLCGAFERQTFLSSLIIGI